MSFYYFLNYEKGFPLKVLTNFPMYFRFIKRTELRGDGKISGWGGLWVPLMLLRRSLYFTEISLCLTSLQFLHPARWYRSLFSSSVRSKNSSLHLHISAGYQHPQNCIRGLSLLTLHTSESESGERPRPPEWRSMWPPCCGRGLWARLWTSSEFFFGLFWPGLLGRLCCWRGYWAWMLQIPLPRL